MLRNTIWEHIMQNHNRKFFLNFKEVIKWNCQTWLNEQINVLTIMCLSVCLSQDGRRSDMSRKGVLILSEESLGIALANAPLDSMNTGKSSQLGKHGFGVLHNFTSAYYENEDILLRHWLHFTNEVDYISLNSLLLRNKLFLISYDFSENLSNTGLTFTPEGILWNLH